MATTDPHRGHPGSSREYQAEPTAKPRRNPWIWVSAFLAIVVVGLVIWQLDTQSELDKTQQTVKDQQAQIDKATATGTDAAASYKTAYQDLEQELGTTQQDLSQIEQELKDAQKSATQAQQDATAAKQQAEQANTANDKAAAEADQAKAEADAATAQTTITKDCANAFLAEISTVMQSEDPNAAAAAAKQELQAIAKDCKAALAQG